MRNFIKNEITSTLDLVDEGLEYLTNPNCKEDEEFIIINAIQNSIQEIKKAIDNKLNKNKPIEHIKTINNLHELIKKLSLNHSNYLITEIIEKSKSLREIVQRTTPTINIVFICYNYSMWDSFHTIWKSANADKNCDVVVLPIPFYEIKNNNELVKHDVNLKTYPKQLQAKDYKIYSIEDSKPDIVYIHNPYDQYNKITITDEVYFSYNIKKYCDLLVYVPYYLAARRFSSFNRFAKEPDLIYGLPAEINSDYLIVSTDEWSKAMQFAGCDYSKIISTGSSKIEATRYYTELSSGTHIEWNQKAKKRKTVLINSSITDLLNKENYIETMDNLIRNIINDTDIFLIWRPHPHLMRTIRSLKPRLMSAFNQLVSHVENSENAVIDISEGPYDAIIASDALISDNSSLLKTYIYTEKPVLNISVKPNPKAENCILDIYSTYINENCNIDQFIGYIKQGSDPLKKTRLHKANKKLHSIDGSGDRIHKEILFKYLNQLKFL